MLKLFALGVLGYLGYRFVQEQGSAAGGPLPAASPVAGGPLSAHATVQSDPDRPPSVDPYGGG